MKITTPTYGLLRVAAVVPRLNVGDVTFNLEQIIKGAEAAAQRGAAVALFPELSLTGYTCGDLFQNQLLLDETEKALEKLCFSSLAMPGLLIVVGAPVRCDAALLNAAIVIGEGKILAVIPKTFIPNYKEFYEKRWFSSATAVEYLESVILCNSEVPLGTDILLEVGEANVAVEICEDLWAPVPPSTMAALAGADIVLNLSASNELAGKHKVLTSMLREHSRRNTIAYAYASAGFGESTTDLVFAGKAIIAENGSIIAEGERFRTDEQIVVADIDIDALRNERRAVTTHADALIDLPAQYRYYGMDNLNAVDYETERWLRPMRKLPFVPVEGPDLDERCMEIANIQSEGLMRRLSAIRATKSVIGISGGVDSTLALMVTVQAYDRLGLDRKGIYGITMPGFGTTGRTYNNALNLMKALGITSLEISIVDAVKQHFADIGQDIDNHDVTYENCQARERTQILMDYANKLGGLVVGTGDLSEAALGWSTYNGDHMSMYNPNCGIPKTLARHLVRWFALTQTDDSENGKIARQTLLDVYDTPISPELTPADEQGNIKQKTEDIVGPYELHDFFLYNMLRYGFGPRKIYRLAVQTFADTYDAVTIKRWLQTFTCRFFNNQFKRSCVPDGPKVGSVSLSPRGDWRMPSDASSALWMREIEQIIV